MNGKPGDHPINDILDYKLPRFSPEVDALVQRLGRLVSRERLWDMFDWFQPPPLPEFARQLRERVELLEQEAHDRGWET